MYFFPRPYERIGKLNGPEEGGPPEDDPSSGHRGVFEEGDLDRFFPPFVHPDSPKDLRPSALDHPPAPPFAPLQCSVPPPIRNTFAGFKVL